MPSKTPHLKGYMASTLPNEIIDFWLAKFNPLWSISERRGKLVKKKPEAKGTVTLYFRANRHAKLPRAGQHLDISVEINGRFFTRSYSPTYIDRKNRLIGITVKKVENGIVSTWLTQALRTGEVVLLGLPYGNLSWSHHKEPVLLLAGGSGITPCISLLKENINSHQLIRLDYWCKTREEACFLNQLLTWQQKYPNFKFYLHLTQELAVEVYEKEGRIGDDFVANTPNLDSAYVFACGSAPFIKSVNTLLISRVKSLVTEAFSPVVLEEDYEEEESDRYITLLKQNKVLPVVKGASILDTLLQHNIAHPYGCRMGICKSCACHKVSGKTKSALTLETDSEENLSFRLCTEYAKSDIVLDI